MFVFIEGRWHQDHRWQLTPPVFIQAATVEDVREGAPGSRAGIRPDDVLIEFDGQPVARASHARLAILKAPRGASVPAVVLRNGQRLQFKVTLESSPAQ